MTTENGIGAGETKEDHVKKKLGERFKRAAKGTTVTWKLSCKFIFPAFSNLDTKVYQIHQLELHFIELALPFHLDSYTP